MKKLFLFLGVAVGFVLGSRSGRAPYERLEAQVRQLVGRPEVQGAVDAAFDKATDLTDTAVSEVKERASHVAATAKNASGSAPSASTPQEPTQDPQDKAFGAAASQDQDIVDELEKQGVRADDLSDIPARHPRAGGKAEPTASGVGANPTGETRTENKLVNPPA